MNPEDFLDVPGITFDPEGPGVGPIPGVTFDPEAPDSSVSPDKPTPVPGSDFDPEAPGGGTPPAGGGTSPSSGGKSPDLSPDQKNFFRSLILGDDGKPNPMGLFGIMALLSMMRGSGAQAPVGYQGGIPKYSAVRERVPIPEDPNRRPGSGGRRYFTDMQYVPETGIAAAKTAAAQQAQKLAPKPVPARDAANRELLKKAGLYDDFVMGPTKPSGSYGDTPEDFGYTDKDFANVLLGKSIIPPPSTLDILPPPYLRVEPNTKLAAQGGLMNLAKGRYLNGATDGMADKIPANIDGQQPAALSHGEFVIPADVVSHLGNGNSESGAQRLYDMMDRIRKARTGSTKQGKQINPDKFLPR